MLPLRQHLQPVSVSLFMFQKLVQLRSVMDPSEEPEVRTELQGHCASLFQVHLCSWGCSQRRATVVSWGFTWLVFAVTWVPFDPVQLILSKLLVRTEKNIVWWRFTGVKWPDLKNKGSDTVKFATADQGPPSPFLEKGFAVSFQGVWGF